MSKIRFFALGGLGEIGKNMYVLEINEKIFVFDCGSTTPSSQMFGYDSIIPDFKYLVENKDRIVGIFLTHYKQKAVGGFLRVIKDLKVPFYASNFTIEALKLKYLDHLIEEDETDIDFRVVNSNEPIYFDDVKVSFFNLSGSMPDTFGISINTEISDGIRKNIIYLPDFDFDQNVKGHFRIDFKALNRIADEGVFCLLSPSTGANKIGHITTDGKLDLSLHKLMSHKGRTYILMDAENVSGILSVLDAVNFQKRQVTIIGSKARNLVELSMKLGYSDEYKDSYLPKNVLNDEYRNSDKTVIILAGEHTEEFFALQKIATYKDKHYILKSTDNVTFLLDTPKKYEKVLADSWNNIWFDNANLIEFETKLMPEPMLGAEDLKLLYSLLSPDYIIPISGDYRMLKSQFDILEAFGFDKNNIISLDNGLFASFEDGKLINQMNGIETGDILFGEESDSDINDYVARERQALSQDGFIVVSGMINLKERNIYGDIEITSFGFIPKFGQEDIIKNIKDKFKSIVEEHLKYKKVDYKELRLDLKNGISKLIFRETKKMPVLIPAVIDISN